MLDNNFYVYRHIRPDTDEVFYIGIGNNNDKRVSRYARAKNKGSRRSSFWKKVIDKNNGEFLWEIIYECSSFEEVNKKEIEFIALYGRRDLGKGTLVNLTDGGTGAKNVKMSEEVRKKHSEPMKGSKNKSSKKVINTNTLEIYDTIREVEKMLNMTKGSLTHYLRDKVSNTTPFMYLERYNNLTLDEVCNNVCKTKQTSMKNKKHTEEAKQKMSKSSMNKGGKKVINIETNEEYQTASEASRIYNINISTLVGKLNNKRTNNTNLRYKDGL